MITEATVDPEFAELLVPLSVEERAGLEASLLRDGCRDALVVWGEESILLDGHNRLAICQKHNIPFRTVSVDLPDRDAAKAWIIRNQFARRNLTPYQRAELALALEPIIGEKAAERMVAGKRLSDPVPNLAQGKTRDEVAKVAGVSHGTIAKAKVIRDEADAGTKERLRSGETTIHREYTRLRGGTEGGAKSGSGRGTRRASAGPPPRLAGGVFVEEARAVGQIVEEAKTVVKAILRVGTKFGLSGKSASRLRAASADIEAAIVKGEIE